MVSSGARSKTYSAWVKAPVGPPGATEELAVMSAILKKKRKEKKVSHDRRWCSEMDDTWEVETRKQLGRKL